MESSEKSKSHTPEPELSEGVSSVNDLGLSAALSTFHKSLSRAWSSGTFDDRISIVEKAQPVTEDSLRNQIFDHFSCSKLNQKQYLPIDAFERLFSVDSVAGLIKTSFPKAKTDVQVDKVAEIIGDKDGRSRRRLYGILVAMNRTSHMQDLVKERIFDDDLPLKQSLPEFTHFTTRKQREATESRKPKAEEATKKSTLFQEWERNDIYLFYLYQQNFLVPFFNFQHTNLCYYPLDQEIILPWEEYEQKTNGGTGIVYKVLVHPSHHNYKGPRGSDGCPYFALKEISSSSSDSFHRELEALQRNRPQIQKEKHLIQLHLTFRHGDRLYLLFEWATSNLREFWESHQSVQPTEEVTRWVAQQCQGLANAVKRIHGLATWQLAMHSSPYSVSSEAQKTRGRHGDIKPSNILWFKQRGNHCNLLVLSDLGLTRYHSTFTNSFVPHIDGFTATYRAPEVEMGRHISQRYDIWSLGCVFLEFCVWCVQGWKGLELFEGDRLIERSPNDTDIEIDDYYVMSECPEAREKRAEVKQAVQEWIKDLLALRALPTFVKNLLELIRDRMLVVEAKDRFQIDCICSEIARIMPPPSDHSQNIEDYFAKIRVNKDDERHVPNTDK